MIKTPFFSLYHQEYIFVNNKTAENYFFVAFDENKHPIIVKKR
jgi:hypothetical protein